MQIIENFTERALSCDSIKIVRLDDGLLQFGHIYQPKGFIYQNLYRRCSLALGTKELEKISRDSSASSLQFYVTIRQKSPYTIEGDSINETLIGVRDGLILTMHTSTSSSLYNPSISPFTEGHFSISPTYQSTTERFTVDYGNRSFP